jgi:hypothetical protein
MDDRAELFRALRASTAALLNFDLNHLTPAQNIRVDRAAALRLQLDDLQRRQFAGEAIDMKEFVVASEALERLVGGDPDTGTDGDFEARVQAEFAGEREALSNLLAVQAERLDAADRRESPKLKAQIAELKSEIEQLRSSSAPPPVVVGAPEQPPQATSPLPPPDNRPPSAYLAQPHREYQIIPGGKRG